MLTPQFMLPVHRELVIDLFAGGGGASTGIEQAIGLPVDVAVNHDPQAVALHAMNHPQTRHYYRGDDGCALTKTAQVRMCGNSVSPPCARALVAANYIEVGLDRRAA